MKKFFLSMMLCILTLPLLAASNGSPVAMHVDYLKRYNPTKLSVVNFYNFIYMDNISCQPQNIVPAELDYIIAINGRDPYDIASEDIYPILNGRDGKVTLVMHSIKQDVDYTLQYNPKNLSKEGFDETLENLYGIIVTSGSAFRKARETNLYNDDEVTDWSKYKKISVVISSNDPLQEKEIAKIALNYLKESRFPFVIDDEDPDLIMKVSFDENESVSKTYVPQTTSYIDQGSNVYVTRGKYGIYVNSFKNSPKKVVEGGYTHEDVSNHHFLEISFLDAKKMLDPNQTVPPIVWQLRYDKQMDYKQSLKNACSEVLKYCRAFPGKDQLTEPCVTWSGICWEDWVPVIKDIYSGSPAEQMGLLPGDKILKIDGKSTLDVVLKKWLKGKYVGEYVAYRKPFKNKSIGKILTDQYKEDKEGICYFQGTDMNHEPNNPYYDYTEIRFPEFLNPYHQTTLVIKRNGKKMTLTGHLYQKADFFSIGNILNREIK